MLTLIFRIDPQPRKSKPEEEKKEEGATKEIIFQGMVLLGEDGQLHLSPVVKMISDMIFTVDIMSHYASTVNILVGENDKVNEIRFYDTRTSTC